MINSYCMEAPLNGITSIPNFMKIYQAFQTLLVGDTQTDSHFGMIEVTFNAITTMQNFIQIHQSV
jgi:hypothetical protein